MLSEKRVSVHRDMMIDMVTEKRSSASDQCAAGGAKKKHNQEPT